MEGGREGLQEKGASPDLVQAACERPRLVPATTGYHSLTELSLAVHTHAATEKVLLHSLRFLSVFGAARSHVKDRLQSV